MNYNPLILEFHGSLVQGPKEITLQRPKALSQGFTTTGGLDGALLTPSF